MKTLLRHSGHWLAWLGILAACHHPQGNEPLPVIDWQTSPLDLNLRGMNGSDYLFRCPAGKPRSGSVIGSGPYTDASSICAAAVHAGTLRAERGGMVMIQILPGQPGYHGSLQNFVRSSDYAPTWGGSFAVLSADSFDGKFK